MLVVVMLTDWADWLPLTSSLDDLPAALPATLTSYDLDISLDNLPVALIVPDK